MSNYFEVEVEYRPSSADLDERLKPFIGIFGKRVRGVWTTDSANPKTDGSNFDYTVATDLASPVRAASGGQTVGLIDHSRYAVFGKSYGENDISTATWWNDNSGITKGITSNWDWYSANGIGTNISVSNTAALGFIVGKYLKNDDGSVDYKVWWATSLENGKFHFRD